ncbi:MAG: cytidine/deoxycytidylate deaminase family protein [Candidatus Edwardsbacteria bacterium]|nr:cytidine/deoxycytidylate deaminase family protein [Candidatus Edwardsbacteria bacterium]
MRPVRPVRPGRPSWDRYFMDIAAMVATRSTCLRRRVGAVIVRDKRILATGYNGAPAGLKHCGEIGCIRDKMKVASGQRHELCRAIHAEQNAIIQASSSGVSLKDGAMYTTHHPCVLCSKIIINAGIRRVVYSRGYPDELSRQILKEAKLKVEKFTA